MSEKNHQFSETQQQHSYDESIYQNNDEPDDSQSDVILNNSENDEDIIEDEHYNAHEKNNIDNEKSINIPFFSSIISLCIFILNSVKSFLNGNSDNENDEESLDQNDQVDDSQNNDLPDDQNDQANNSQDNDLPDDQNDQENNSQDNELSDDQKDPTNNSQDDDLHDDQNNDVIENETAVEKHNIGYEKLNDIPFVPEVISFITSIWNSVKSFFIDNNENDDHKKPILLFKPNQHISTTVKNEKKEEIDYRNDFFHKLNIQKNVYRSYNYNVNPIINDTHQSDTKFEQASPIENSYSPKKPKRYLQTRLRSKKDSLSKIKKAVENQMSTPTENKPSRPLTEEDKQRQLIGKETMHVVETGKLQVQNTEYNIKEKIRLSIMRTETIKPYQQISITQNLSKDARMAQIEVTTESSFSAIYRLIVKKQIKETCMLNFASAIKPGGGFLNGRIAQEETICRQSALYSTLLPQKEMYDYTNSHKNNPYYSDYMIYSPYVPFFRNDKYDFIQPFYASVITAAAVNCSDLKKSGKIDNEVKEKIFETMKERCKKILRLCISKGNKAMVLGAFGCGVFKNPPEMVSQIFKDLLFKEGYGKYLTIVVFPIYSSDGKGGHTYEVFKQNLHV